MGSVEINDARGPAAFDQLMRLEQESTEIFQVQPSFLPGFVQVEGYAAAVIGEITRPAPVDTELTEKVGVRMQRARAFESRLKGETPPRMWAVIDEAVVRRVVGSPAVMREQLAHLIALSRLKTLTLAIIPFDRGVHPGMAGPFEVHQVAEGQAAVFFECTNGDEIVGTDQELVRHYRETAESMLASAVTGDEATALLESISGSLSS
ncbi:hypothetical protein Ato02nite_020320 [Paractinoplanes toevensis]|uniref:DUF5753 domain-containing protein n=2 Tax=Paractinoplanes toevensis TaxID=571911 RepID=A0A919T9N7_9ACTN|nr:hypothetical protein Ato02nite_020320 [Actinoplanes toevensis]